jgi:hypothetical protein
MPGQKRIAAPKFPVMNDDAIKSMVYSLSMWRQGRIFEVERTGKD